MHVPAWTLQCAGSGVADSRYLHCLWDGGVACRVRVVRVVDDERPASVLLLLLSIELSCSVLARVHVDSRPLSVHCLKPQLQAQAPGLPTPPQLN